MDFISNTTDSQTGQRKGHGITGSQPRCKMSRENRNKSRKFQKSSRLVAASLPSAHSEGEGVSSPNRPAGLCCGSSLGNQSCQFQSLQPPSLNICAAGRLPPADPRGARAGCVPRSGVDATARTDHRPLLEAPRRPRSHRPESGSAQPCPEQLAAHQQS